MKKLLLTVFFFFFLFSGFANPGKNHKKLHPSDKVREKYRKKLEKKEKKEEAAFLREKHNSELKKGKGRTKPGNSYESVKPTK